MTWIILQFVFLAMPVVLPALLYRSRRYFMAKFYDKMIWSEKARRLYTHVLLIVLLLFHYVYTSGHPGEFGVVPSTIVCAAWASFRRADRWMRCLLDRPKRFVWFALLALVIGFVPHLYTMSVTISFVLLAALFYPSARVMSERTDMRKFLEWLEYPGALADSYHNIITRGCHDNADNGNLKLSAHYESSKTERK